jgi:hypothetical protein
MPGKPFQSKLSPHEEEIFALLDAGRSFRQVAEQLNRSHGLGVTHNAVFSFAKSRRKRRGARLFFEGLSPGIRDQMLKQIAAVWTHDSTAIERFTALMQTEWQRTLTPVAEARRRETERQAKMK